MNLRRVRHSCFLVCLSVLLGFSWTAQAVAGNPADLRLAARPIQSPKTKPLVDVNPTQPPATSVTPTTAGSVPVPAPARLIRVEGLTRQQFDQLNIQDNDMIEYKGIQYNVGTLRTQMQKADATALATLKQKATEAQGRFEAYRTNFAKVQLSNLAAVNAKTDAMAKELMQRVQASGKALPSSRPMITETSVAGLTPGGLVLIVGSGFGYPIGLNAPGIVYLNVGNLSHPVEIRWWSDTAILGIIPPGISGILDQPGTLAVKVGGIESNRWPVKFIAARDVISMIGPQGVQVVSCSDSSASKWCDNSKDGVWSPTGWSVWNKTFAGGHMGAWYQWVAKGSDVYSASLKNGWTFDKAITWYMGPPASTGEMWGVGGSGTAILNGFKPSSYILNLVVDWNFDVMWFEMVPYPGRVYYTVELYIVGPRGIPYF